MSPAPPRRNPSLQRKTAARMAAAQCLYQLWTGEDAAPEALIARVLEAHADGDDPEYGLPAAPDEKLLAAIVGGACGARADLEATLLSALPHYWKGERLTPLLKAILLAAAYELAFHPQLKLAIVMDEYTSVTAAFFGEQETRLVNGLLQELARAARPTDAAP